MNIKLEGLPEEEQAELERIIAKRQKRETAEAIDREAYAVLRFIKRPQSLILKTCSQCGEKFRTNYSYQGLCSRGCLKGALEAIGLAWNPTKSEQDRWQGEPPVSIKPETLKILRQWATQILEVPEPVEVQASDEIVMQPHPHIPVMPVPGPEPEQSLEDYLDDLLS